MEFFVELEQQTGMANFYRGSKLVGTAVHQLTGDDWKRIDLGKLEIASNLWNQDGVWKVSVYPVDPKTGYIKLNRSYPVQLTVRGGASVAA
jgi:hypothetical protein